MELTVGKTIDGWCARCKTMLRHTIEAMEAGKIARTHCNTCGGRHAHRAQPPRSRVANRVSQETAYATLLRGRKETSARPYSTSGRFAVGELVSHASLGLGVVTGARDNVKIDIMFPDGAKVLQQGC